MIHIYTKLQVLNRKMSKWMSDLDMEQKKERMKPLCIMKSLSEQLVWMRLSMNEKMTPIDRQMGGDEGRGGKFSLSNNSGN